MRRVRLHRIAHARAGDKGDTSNISVIAYSESSWNVLLTQLTADHVARAFSDLTSEPIRRYELPQLRALNFVIPGALNGGVTRSLALDAHGKSLSYLMLNIEISIPEETP